MCASGCMWGRVWQSTLVRVLVHPLFLLEVMPVTQIPLLNCWGFCFSPVLSSSTLLIIFLCADIGGSRLSGVPASEERSLRSSHCLPSRLAAVQGGLGTCALTRLARVVVFVVLTYDQFLLFTENKLSKNYEYSALECSPLLKTQCSISKCKSLLAQSEKFSQNSENKRINPCMIFCKWFWMMRKHLLISSCKKFCASPPIDEV